MSSKSSIISQIKNLNMEEKPLPEIPDFEVAANLEEAFAQSLAGNKGQVVSKDELEALIAASDFKKIYSSSPLFDAYSNCELPAHPAEFADLDLAILEGQVASAENGAIWLDESNLGIRAIPFITSHLVILIRGEAIVGNMHEAYQKIGSAHSGFGAFIAGPSKTADIEQSLVVGAHGAMSLRVVIL
ncbi:LUD domain-containing protein [Algoriphagus halophytocola]|uniref:LUD domain-containing protein n=1 Tax=Algoriphagus halophytocola TaxID=2991499 RepID=A0ABY6MFT7_9BACT|nr:MULTISPECIES: LUD domain-containing protein [unclassified Algoriphagus]UZD22656.1 LUD domain-containing protein [Algoriphagus sp. TR-M5]WBL43921.1 LUD domain-containing protein [Algoriphagus sp. TR-M9]